MLRSTLNLFALKCVVFSVIVSSVFLGQNLKAQENLVNCNDGAGSDLKITKVLDDGSEKNRPASYKDVVILLKGPVIDSEHSFFSKQTFDDHQGYRQFYNSVDGTLEISALVDENSRAIFGLACAGGNRYQRTVKVVTDQSGIGVKIYSFESGTPIESGLNWYFGHCQGI